MFKLSKVDQLNKVLQKIQMTFVNDILSHTHTHTHTQNNNLMASEDLVHNGETK